MGLEMRNKRHFGLRSKTQQIELCKKKNVVALWLLLRPHHIIGAKKHLTMAKNRVTSRKDMADRNHEAGTKASRLHMKFLVTF